MGEYRGQALPVSNPGNPPGCLTSVVRCYNTDNLGREQAEQGLLLRVSWGRWRGFPFGSGRGYILLTTCYLGCSGGQEGERISLITAAHSFDGVVCVYACVRACMRRPRPKTVLLLISPCLSKQDV